jgi:hypothetical protein
MDLVGAKGSKSGRQMTQIHEKSSAEAAERAHDKEFSRILRKLRYLSDPAGTLAPADDGYLPDTP